MEEYSTLENFLKIEFENPFQSSETLLYRHVNSYHKQMLDVWGEMSNSLSLYKMVKKKKATMEDLMNQLNSFHRCCYVVYSDEKNSEGLKWELRIAEWELYDFILWNNEFHNTEKTVTTWFDQWCYA